MFPKSLHCLLEFLNLFLLAFNFHRKLIYFLKDIHPACHRCAQALAGRPVDDQFFGLNQPFLHTKYLFPGFIFLEI